MEKEKKDILSIEKDDKKNNEINLLKNEVQRSNSLLKLIPEFEKSPLFEKTKFKKGEFLFQEGELDNNIYIIKSGSLSVEKFTTIQKDSFKQLAILKTGDFLGEGAISGLDIKKEVGIKSIETSQVLKIDAKKDLKKYIEENPLYGFEFLKLIIIETNKRLLEANKLIASNYEIEKTIDKLKVIDLKNIFGLIDKIKDILDVDYILYLEKHPVLEDFLQLKYDSRQPNKLQDKIFEKTGKILNLEEILKDCNVGNEDKTIINKIYIGDEIFGYLIIGRYKKLFDGSDKKVFSSMTNSLAGILKKFLSDKENKDRFYISESKKY